MPPAAAREMKAEHASMPGAELAAGCQVAAVDADGEDVSRAAEALKQPAERVSFHPSAAEHAAPATPKAAGGAVNSKDANANAADPAAKPPLAAKIQKEVSAPLAGVQTALLMDVALWEHTKTFRSLSHGLYVMPKVPISAVCAACVHEQGLDWQRTKPAMACEGLCPAPLPSAQKSPHFSAVCASTPVVTHCHYMSRRHGCVVLHSAAVEMPRFRTGAALMRHGCTAVQVVRTTTQALLVLTDRLSALDMVLCCGASLPCRRPPQWAYMLSVLASTLAGDDIFMVPCACVGDLLKGEFNGCAYHAFQRPIEPEVRKPRAFAICPGFPRALTPHRPVKALYGSI